MNFINIILICRIVPEHYLQRKWNILNCLFTQIFRTKMITLKNDVVGYDKKCSHLNVLIPYFMVCYICIGTGDQLSRGGWYPINRFNQSTFLSPYPSQDVDFHHMSWTVFVWTIWGEILYIFLSVDIVTLVDHHCIKFSFTCDWSVGSLCSPVSSTNKTDRHDILAEILFKVALIPITMSIWYFGIMGLRKNNPSGQWALTLNHIRTNSPLEQCNEI
jgi:hypothetical protein